MDRDREAAAEQPVLLELDDEAVRALGIFDGAQIRTVIEDGRVVLVRVDDGRIGHA